jgi:homoserine dehydrogenase
MFQNYTRSTGVLVKFKIAINDAPKKFTSRVEPPRIDNRQPIQPLQKTENFVNITSFAFKNVLPLKMLIKVDYRSNPRESK